MAESLSVSQFHMGCQWTIQAFPQPYFNEDKTKGLINQAYELVRKIEGDLTEFQTSFITLINENAGKRAIVLNKEYFNLFQRAIRFSQMTEGVFDITFRSSSEETSYKDIVFNPKAHSIYLPKKDMKVSLGGIGKGYAVDRVFEFLKQKGMANFVVNGSGDLRCHSLSHAPRSWRFGITNPFNPKFTAGVLTLGNGAMATSGSYFKPGHISGVEDLVSVTVLGEKAEEVDAWGTYLMSLGATNALNLVNQQQKKAVFIKSNGKVLLSQKIVKSLQNFGNQYEKTSFNSFPMSSGSSSRKYYPSRF